MFPRNFCWELFPRNLFGKHFAGEIWKNRFFCINNLFDFLKLLINEICDFLEIRKNFKNNDYMIIKIYENSKI